jgi:hypothetical protein
VKQRSYKIRSTTSNNNMMVTVGGTEKPQLHIYSKLWQVPRIVRSHGRERRAEISALDPAILKPVTDSREVQLL